jgi:hypothetical protein
MLTMPSYSLKLDSRSVEIRDPFFIFEFANVLDAGFYQELDAAFPAKEEFPASWTNRGGKYYMHNKMPEYGEFTRRVPLWTRLYERFAAPETMERFYELLQMGSSGRPPQDMRPWAVDDRESPKGIAKRPLMALRRYMDRRRPTTPIRLQFEFSFLESSCYIPPHTDTPSKLVTLMLYFPDDGATYPRGTGTEFYRGMGNTPATPGWSTGMMNEEDTKEFFRKHEIFYVSDFTPNKLVGFIKSGNSWHGVQPLTLAPGVTRRSLNINYYLS